MAAIAYLFLITISFASGTFLPYGSPWKIQPKLPYHSTYEFPHPESAISPQSFLDNCRLRHTLTFRCYLELQNVFGRIREYPKPKIERNTLKANAKNSVPGILNDNNKQIDKPESYINSILDEDKRDASNLNASDKVLNSTWIEIKDPRKTAIPIKSEIADAKEADEFVAFRKENTVTGKKTDPDIAEEKAIKTNSTAADDSNADGKTKTEIQQTTTITRTSGIVTSGEIDERTTVPGETSDINRTLEVTGANTTTYKDLISSMEPEEENKRNTIVQNKTNDDSISENAEKSTTADLHTDSTKFSLKIMTENATVNETDIEVTSEKGAEDIASNTEQNLSTDSRSTLTSGVPDDLNNDTTLEKDDSTTSTVSITTLPTDPTKTESISVSDADISLSSETESATSSSFVTFPSVSVTESPGYTTESSDGGFTSTMVTDSKPSNGHYVTKSIPVVPEHTINIRSIKIAKVVLSVLLLVTGLIAVVMLAVYLFRVRRGAVQYDQLTLLP